ncbi:glycosyltransferase family 1 protein [Salana multivorans]
MVVLSFSRLRSDPRVSKQLALLVGEHHVTTIGHGPAPEAVAHHIEIPEELQVWQYPRRELLTRRFARAYSANPAVAFVRDATREINPGLVVANDIDAAGVALAMRPRRGLHLDLHEFAPEQKSEQWRFRTFVAPLLRWQLREFATRAASITTQCADFAERYEREFGLAAEVVLNATPFHAAAPTPTREPIRLVHAGVALRNRRIEEMIRGAGAAGQRFTFDLYLAPNDAGYVEELRGIARDYSTVTVHDPLPFEQMIERLADHDVGVHLLAPTNYNNAASIPNKLFDFVQARLGVIIGPSRGMELIVHAHGLGVVTRDFSAEALRETLAGIGPSDVDRWKAASNAAARSLSAEAQVRAWRELFAARLQ